jgi:hypothetical protein
MDTWSASQRIVDAHPSNARIDLPGNSLKDQFIMAMHTHFLRDDTHITQFVAVRTVVGKAVVQNRRSICYRTMTARIELADCGEQKWMHRALKPNCAMMVLARS